MMEGGLTTTTSSAPGAQPPQDRSSPRGAWTRPRHARSITVAIRAFEVLFIVGLLYLALHDLSDRWHYFRRVGRAQWLDDYAELKGIIQDNYPDLDWTITAGGLDLRRLDERTTRRLEQAESPKEAERALREFTAAFHDGHLAIRNPKWHGSFETPPTEITLSSFTAGPKACSAMSFGESDDTDFGLWAHGVSPARALPGRSPFPAAVLTVEGHDVGLIRIPSFLPSAYGDTCASEWDRFRAQLSTTCEEPCQARFRAVMESRLLDELGVRIGQLKDAGVGLLVLDLRDNGGGIESFARSAVEMLAGRALPAQRTEAVVSRHVAAVLASDRDAVEREIALCPSPSRARDELEEAYWRLDREIAEIRIPCDRSAVWSDWGVRPGCATLVPVEARNPYVSVAEDVSLWRRTIGPSPADGDVTPARARWHGRLAVLVNRGTASGGEAAAAALQDYAAALVIGERTAGCGGGWAFGAVHWTLANSKVKVYVPDHASYRRDGTNLNAGVTPDEPARFGPREATQGPELYRVLRELARKGRDY